MVGGVTSPKVLVDEWQIAAAGGLGHVALILLAAAVIAGLIWTWRSLDPRRSVRLRAAIILLRAGALTMAVGLVLQPTLRIRRMKPLPSLLTILVDVSDSMTRNGDASRLAEVKRVIPLARRVGGGGLGNVTPPTGLEDRDGDGVPDVYDAYPDDSDSSFKLSVPAEGKLTIAFEDLFGRANAGDADYNDFVAAYSITEASGDGGVNSITIMSNAVAKLAGYDHKFGIRIDSFIGDATLTGTYIRADGTEGTYDDVRMSAPAEILLFENSRNAVGPEKVVEVTLTFDDPQPRGQNVVVVEGEEPVDGLPDPPYNPFAIVKNTGHDIHLIGQEALTELIDSINPDDTFRDGDGFPWALLVPNTWEHPAETENIATPYPRFTLWRDSLGALHTDWYLYNDLPPAVEPGVYVAGYYDDGSQDMAAYWANGVLTTLPLPDNSSGARANAIAVDGSTIYVAGWYADPETRNRVAAYWAGGEPVALTSPDEISEATGIAVDGGTLYVSGKSISADFLTDTAFYFEGDTRVELYTGPSFAASTAIHVSSGAAYVAGYSPTDQISRGASYWIDAAPAVDLSGGLASQAWDIDVSASGDVYIAGNVRDPNTSNYASVYWINDAATVTTLYLNTEETTGNYSRAYGIDESGGTVFTAGHYETDTNQYAVYWEDTVVHVLSAGSPIDTANDIIVSAGTIHVVGTVTVADREVAVLWSDGTEDILYDSGAAGTNAGAIGVTYVAP